MVRVLRGTCVGSLCLLVCRDSVGCICVCVCVCVCVCICACPHMHTCRQLWTELDPEAVFQDSQDLTGWLQAVLVTQPQSASLRRDRASPDSNKSLPTAPSGGDPGHWGGGTVP